jgi:transcriptional regulator with XRE-family HTH domain
MTKTQRPRLYDSDRVRAQMTAARVTVSTLAAITRLTAPTISKVRAGRDVRVSTLCSVARALGIPVGELFTESR